MRFLCKFKRSRYAPNPVTACAASLAAAFALGPAAAAHPNAATPAAPPTSTAQAAPAAPTAPAAPASGSPRPSALLGAADEITRQVSTMRGLPLKAPFQRGVLSRSEIVDKLRERLAKEFSKEEVRVESGILKRLGLLPENIDYEKTLFEMLAEQVAGFYDPYVRTLYIADWLPIELQRPALAHEIEHALQDQYFDLRKFSAPLKEEGDRQLARSAVVEGDGTAVMLEYSRRNTPGDTTRVPADIGRLGKQMMQLSMSSTPAFQKAPAALRETLVFPYAAGLEFVISRRQGFDVSAKGAFARVDELFRNPPDSTEQVLHPEKYEAREPPVRITAAPLTTLAPQIEVRRDVLGEQVYKLWFDSLLPESQAIEAAAGWGGDRLVAYQANAEGLPALIMLSAWDSDKDAIEAEAASRKVLLNLAGIKDSSNVAPRRPHDTPGMFRESGGLSFGLLRRGKLLLILCGTPKGSEARLIEEVFSRFKVDWPQGTP